MRIQTETQAELAAQFVERFGRAIMAQVFLPIGEVPAVDVEVLRSMRDQLQQQLDVYHAERLRGAIENMAAATDQPVERVAQLVRSSWWQRERLQVEVERAI